MRGRIVKQARAFDVRIGAQRAIMGQTENGPGGAGNTVTPGPRRTDKEFD